MTTNVEISTFESTVIVYLMDGTTQTVAPYSVHFLQLPDLGYCTISDTGGNDDAEHQPPGEDFAKQMLEYWQAFWKGLKAAAQGPEATPL